jgi:hypothetical protein
MAEWSKAVDSSSTIFVCVGSNPTGVIQLKAPVAQSAEHRSYVARVEGSNPSGCKVLIYLNKGLRFLNKLLTN